jgi:hypothetical protein
LGVHTSQQSFLQLILFPLLLRRFPPFFNYVLIPSAGAHTAQPIAQYLHSTTSIVLLSSFFSKHSIVRSQQSRREWQHISIFSKNIARINVILYNCLLVYTR